MNGVLISGFVAIELDRAVYPLNIIPTLHDIEYKLDVDLQLAAESLDSLMDNIFETLYIREKALYHFWENEKWDFFIGIITSTDRLHHYFWDAYEDSSHVFHGRFMEFYKKVDDIIGKFYSTLPENATFIMLSDHGFTGIDKEIYLNNLFIENGFLKFCSDNKDLENIHPSTTHLFSIPVECILT